MAQFRFITCPLPGGVSVQLYTLQEIIREMVARHLV